MVSEVIVLKIENIGLKLQMLQAQANGLLSDQKALIEQARIEEGAPEDFALNLDTGTFQAPPKA